MARVGGGGKRGGESLRGVGVAGSLRADGVATRSVPQSCPRVARIAEAAVRPGARRTRPAWPSPRTRAHGHATRTDMGNGMNKVSAVAVVVAVAAALRHRGGTRSPHCRTSYSYL